MSMRGRFERLHVLSRHNPLRCAKNMIIMDERKKYAFVSFILAWVQRQRCLMLLLLARRSKRKGETFTFGCRPVYEAPPRRPRFYVKRRPRYGGPVDEDGRPQEYSTAQTHTTTLADVRRVPVATQVRLCSNKLPGSVCRCFHAAHPDNRARCGTPLSSPVIALLSGPSPGSAISGTTQARGITPTPNECVHRPQLIACFNFLLVVDNWKRREREKRSCAHHRGARSVPKSPRSSTRAPRLNSHHLRSRVSPDTRYARNQLIWPDERISVRFPSYLARLA